MSSSKNSILDRINKMTNIDLEKARSVENYDDLIELAKIEVSSVCTLSCNFCYAKEILKKEPYRHGFMELDELKIVLDVLKDKYKNLREIGLFFLGEPGIHPDLGEMYEYVKNQEFFTFLTTNGCHELPEKVVENVDSLKISWNYKDHNDFIIKSNARDHNVYFRIIDNINKSYEMVHKYNKELSISTILHPDDTPTDYSKSLKLLKYDNHYFIPLQNQGGYFEYGDDGVLGNTSCLRKAMPCWSLIKGVYVTKDLSVRPCCYGHTPILSFIDHHKKVLVEKNDKHKMIKDHLNGIIPAYCKDCLYHLSTNKGDY